MFDIGFQELLLISVISLLIMGPERLPGAVRTASLWLSRLRRSFQQIKSEIEHEVGVDEIKQQIHNESIMKSLEQAKSDLQQELHQATESLKPDLEETHSPQHLQVDDAGDIINSDKSSDTSPGKP